MSCGGRVYKGDSIAISIPFDVSGYTDLTVSYFTIGDTKIVRDESGLTVADGYITAEFSGHDLDLLPDGVVRYTIEYAVDNTDYVESSNTMLFLKTPASYNSITPEEIYQSGYTAGYDDCGEGDCSEIQTIAFNSGLTVGYAQGQADCPECSGSCQMQQKTYSLTTTGDGSWSVQPDDGYDGMASLAIYDNAGYGEGKYNQGITKGMADQRALLGSQTFTSNQTATNPNGWSSVTVNVPKEVVLGTLISNPLKSELSSDRYWIREFDSGTSITDGWGMVRLDMKNMMDYGKAQQKALLSSTAITDNGTYTREDGWSSVTVNVTCPSVNPLKCVVEFSLDEDYTFPSGNEPYAIWVGPSHAYTVLLDDELVALWEGQTLHAGNHKAEVSNSMISNTKLFLIPSIGYFPNGGGEGVPTQVTITSTYVEAS